MAYTTVNTGVTEMDLILSIVQKELVYSAKLRPTVMDFSANATKGVKSIDIPRYDSSYSNTPPDLNPDGVTSPSEEEIDFAVDTINLDVWKNRLFSIPDRIETQSMIPVTAKVAQSAGKSFGRFMDEQIVSQLRLAADGTGGLPDHRIQLSGNTNTEITLGDITEARRLLNVAEVDEDQRTLLISHDQEKAMLNIANFIKANEYGAREGLLDGEIGRVFGFRVMTHSALASTEAIAYHKEAVAVAVQKELKYETDRDIKNQKTVHSFSMGMGKTVLEQGVKQVLLNSTGT